MKRAYQIGILVVGLCLSSTLLADTESDYASAQAYFSSQNLSDATQSAVSNANQVLPEVPSDPDQSKYYDQPEGMSADAASSIDDPETVGYAVTGAALSRPKMIINSASPEVVFSKTVQSNAEAISDGTYKDCDKEVIIENSSTTKTCSTSLPFKFSCTKALEVSVEEQWTDEQSSIDLGNSLEMTGASDAVVSTSLSEGVVTSLSMHVRNGANPWSCSQTYGLKLNGVSIGSYHGECGKYLGDLSFSVSGVAIPFSDQSIVLTLVGGGLSGSASGSLSVSYKTLQKTPVETWESSCASIPASCHVDKTECLEAGSTKVFDGVSVTASCWKETETNQCGGSMSEACKALEDEGCTQISSSCETENSGICESYAEAWSCPGQKTIGTGLQCGEKFFCMDGSCEATEHEQNADFGQSITELGATAAAGEDVQQQGVDSDGDVDSILIFEGETAHCREVVLGTMNCCADSGWAEGLLLNCNDEEKRIGHAKEQGDLVVDTGRYCSDHALGVCTEHKEGYCVFPSRIAYDIQVGGRRDQLGRDFGNAELPDCSGLSSTEIGQIDFDQVDFSNTTDSIVADTTLPNDSQSQSNIDAQINEAIARELQ